ncbi:HK97 gp10 family phage protein [Janthinobacterium sp. 35]|uniref:HK97-gp10 family putative phage morphogenesis protein n=1 Tax=Janthinobacterium sp. 35 TaxID=2035210 RepID=UPI000C178002|nr:HK97-gp10 family putative phage morphogenesis protein [Janthinobacterium sp. 35]PIG29403.1 HK97 gp10 family phage protein [Janthinobacterium sp. 35]
MSVDDLAISGGKKLDDLLKTLPGKLQKNIMRSAIRAGVVVYRDKVKELVPVHMGELKKSIRISTKLKGGVVTASLKVGSRKAWYAKLVEFGTRPHKITPKDARALEIGGAVVESVDHPGAQAHPYMRPAADAGHTAALAAVVDQLRKRLTLAGLDASPPPEEP